MSQLTRIPVKAVFLFLVLVMLFLSSGGKPVVQAQGGTPPELFAEAEMPFDGDRPAPAYVIRSAYVNVNINLLFDGGGQIRSRKTLPEISLNLFPDTNYIGIVTKAEQTSTSMRWSGRLKGKQPSYFYLVVVNDVFTAHIASMDGVYDISWHADNLYKITQVDQSQLGEDEVINVDFSDGADRLEQVFAPKGGGTPGIDVMVLYTEKARSAQGGTEQMQAHIEMGIEQANDSYIKSGVLARLRLVHAEEIQYKESSDIEVDLEYLGNPTDRIIDDVHRLRNIYGADLVALIVDYPWYSSLCGVAAWPPKIAHAFQVTRRGHCMTSQYTLAHEFGHLQGAHHDIYNTRNTEFSYGHGYVYLGLLSGWRTIMATSDLCEDKKGSLYKCTRMLYWSNPSLKIGGRPAGVIGESENSRVLTETAWNISSYKRNQVSGDFFSDFGIRYSGWSPVSGKWTRSNGTYSTGTNGYFNSIIHTGNYVDFKYEARLKRTDTKHTITANNLMIRGTPNPLWANKEWSSMYAFQYTNEGDFSVWKTESNGKNTPLKQWTFHSAIRPYDWNKLTVYAIGNRFYFLINDTLVWTGTDTDTGTRLTGGQVGIGRWDILDAPNKFLVDWARLQTIIYADTVAELLSSMEVVSGEEIPGGTIDRSPSR